MKRFYLIAIFSIIFCFVTRAQFKADLDKNTNYDIPDRSSQSSLILGFFNPENFSMKHSYSFVYSNFGSNSLGMGIYTNSMKYKFTPNLNARVDISLIHSPFGSYSKSLSDNMTGIYVTRADINYKPFDNFVIQLKYRQLPGYGYYGYSPFMSNSYGGFYSDYDDDYFPFR